MKWLLRAIAFALLSLAPVHAGQWETFEQCTLVTKEYFDGDSFHVATKKPGAQKGYTYILRLYGVDCPETDRRHPDRVEEQAKAFGVGAKEVLAWGAKAKEFTRKFLAKPFTVHTKKEKAGGESEQNRYFAVVVGSGGERLDEALVQAGLARAYGAPADWPAKTRPEHFEGKLHSLESAAKRAKTGVWQKR